MAEGEGFARKNVRPVSVVPRCRCGGEFEMVNSLSYTLTTYPPKYQHICNKCGATEWFNETYPKIEYVGIDTPEESAIEHHLKMEIRQTKEWLKGVNEYFNGVLVGYNKSAKLMKKHIMFCEHLLKLIAKDKS
jgi:hypothetical protein